MDNTKDSENNLSNLKAKICDMENRMANESSIQMQKTLRKQLSELRNLYSSSLNLEISDITPSKCESLKDNKSSNSNDVISNTQKESLSTPHFKNLSNFKIDGFDCVDAVVENCNFINSDLIKCKGTFNLKNTHNATINVHTTHFRITNSSDVILNVFSKTGIYLQDSTRIKIIPIQEPNNNCEKVFDFNSPLENKNFTISH